MKRTQANEPNETSRPTNKVDGHDTCSRFRTNDSAHLLPLRQIFLGDWKESTLKSDRTHTSVDHAHNKTNVVQPQDHVYDISLPVPWSA